MTKIPEIEKQPLSVIKKFQDGKLAVALEYLSTSSQFYKRMFEKNHIDVVKIINLEDLIVMHVTDKDDLHHFLMNKFSFKTQR